MRNTYYKKATQIMSVGITLSLSGCMGVYEGGFECPSGKA